jgi:lysozyme family protein
MSFVEPLQLVRQLEGGKHKANAADPNDTNCGIIQSTWEGLGYRGSVLNASDGDIANCYHHLWSSGGTSVYDAQTGQSRSIFDMLPEPVDAFAFQFYINVPPGTFRRSLQAALRVTPDGSFGSKTLFALEKMPKEELLARLEMEQRQHYIDKANPIVLDGLLNRVDRAYRFCYNNQED